MNGLAELLAGLYVDDPEAAVGKDPQIPRHRSGIAAHVDQPAGPHLENRPQQSGITSLSRRIDDDHIRVNLLLFIQYPAR